MPPLWKIYLAILFVTTAEGGMNTILPPYLDRAEYGVELIGMVTALFALLSLVSRLPSGALYTGTRARRLIVAFTALFILSTSTFGIGTNALLIFPLTVLHGFAFGAITTIMLPVAIQLHARDAAASHGARMGWYTAALSAGYALGSFLSGALADRFGYSAAFIAMGLLPVGTIGLTLALPSLATEPSAENATRPNNQLGGWQIRAMFSSAGANPMLLFATLIAFYINFLDDGFGTFFPLFGLGIGLSLTAIGNLKGIKSATGIIVRIFSGSIFNWLDYRLLNHALVVGWSLVVFFLPDIKAEWVFIAAFIFMGLARSLSRVTSATIVAEEKAHDPAGIGIASGIYNMGLDLGSLAGPLIAGFVARATGIPTMMRIIPVMMVAIYFGALVWLNRATAAGRRATASLSGIVRSGKGEARGFTQLDWVREQFREKLGFEPYPGTLNVETKNGAAPAVLRSARGIMIEPAPNFCAARCYRVRLGRSDARVRVDAVWIVPEVADYPRRQVELIAPISLREALGLKDGTDVTLKLTGDM